MTNARPALAASRATRYVKYLGAQPLANGQARDPCPLDRPKDLKQPEPNLAHNRFPSRNLSRNIPIHAFSRSLPLLAGQAPKLHSTPGHGPSTHFFLDTFVLLQVTPYIRLRDDTFRANYPLPATYPPASIYFCIGSPLNHHLSLFALAQVGRNYRESAQRSPIATHNRHCYRFGNRTRALGTSSRSNNKEIP